MAEMKDVLREIVNVDGVRTAVVVGRDGFIIEGVSNDKTVDTEAVGAVISTGLATLEKMAKDLAVGGMNQGMLEYEKGVLVVGALGEFALLCVVCQTNANLGMVRMQIKKRSVEIVDMI
jgi:hypothetical protein